MIKNFKEMEDRLKSHAKKPILGIVNGHDMHSLEAAKEALDNDLIEVVLVGIEEKIDDILIEIGLAKDKVRVINCVGDAESAALAVKMAKDGDVDLCRISIASLCIMAQSIKPSMPLRIGPS